MRANVAAFVPQVMLKTNLFFLLLSSPLRRRLCYFLARQKVTKERPEGAEEGASLDFSPLWTPPAGKVSCGKEPRGLTGLVSLPSLRSIRN